MSRRFRLGTMVVALALLGWSQARAQDSACTAPAPVCAARGAVFAIESAFDPQASATRIGPDLLVTNRHVMADETRAKLRLPDGGARAAEVVPSAYPGDLVLLRVAGLGEGPVLQPGAARAEGDVSVVGDLYVVGVDIETRRVRATAPGRPVLAPAAGKPLARLYHSAPSRPGHSGGALLDGQGRLIGIVASGGEGNNEAIPAAGVVALLAARGPAYAGDSRARGAATRVCSDVLDRAARVGPRLNEALAKALERACAASGNRQLLDLAAQALGRSARHERAIALFERALEEDPNAINARIGLVVTLQLARRYAAAAPHLVWLLGVKADNLQVLRMATLSGKWGAAPELAARALALIETHHPLMAPSARKFLGSPDRPPSRPSAPQ